MLHLNDSSQVGNSEATTTASLQPMGFADILDTTFSLYRNHFRLFLGICTVPILFRIAFSAFTDMWTELFCGIVVSALCYGLLVYASGQAYLGRHITLYIAFMQVNHRFWVFLGCALLWCLGVGANFVFGLTTLVEVIAGVSVSVYSLIIAIFCLGLSVLFIGTLWAFYAQAVLVEGKSVWNAQKRSAELVTGAWWRVFGFNFAIFLLYFMFELILITSSTLIFTSSGIAEEGELVEMILNVQLIQIMCMVLEFGYGSSGTSQLLRVVHTAINTLALPILAIGFTLLYFDRRIRKEGFDIEMKVAKDEVKEY